MHVLVVAQSRHAFALCICKLLRWCAFSCCLLWVHDGMVPRSFVTRQVDFFGTIVLFWRSAVLLHDASVRCCMILLRVWFMGLAPIWDSSVGLFDFHTQCTDCVYRSWRIQRAQERRGVCRGQRPVGVPTSLCPDARATAWLGAWI